MKISRIEIAGFGKLKNFTLDLTDNLNVIFGENENGKTTVMSFIKCMFYGTGNKKQSLKESIREKYRPWDGSVMGGKIFFENNGVNFLLEREFKGSDSTDRVSLINKDTGKELPAGSKVGEGLFSMTENAFVRSIFIDNNVSFSPDNVANADFNSRLSSGNIANDGDFSEQTVEKNILSTKNRILSSSGRAGSLVKDKEEYRILSDKIDLAYNAEHQMSEIAENLKQAKEKADTLSKKIAEEKAFIENENSYKNAQKLNEYISTKEEIEKLDKSLLATDKTALPITFSKIVAGGLAAFEKKKTRVEDLEAEIAGLNKDLNSQNNDSLENAKKALKEITASENNLLREKEELQNSLSKLEGTLDTAEQTSAGKTKQVLKIMFIISGIALILAAVLFKIFVDNKSYLYLLFAGVGIALIVAGLFIKNNKKSEKLKEELNARINNLHNKITAIDLKVNSLAVRRAQCEGTLNTGTALKSQRTNDLKQKSMLLEEAKEKLEGAKLEVLTYFSKWKEVSTIDEVIEENEKLNELYERRKELSTTLNLYVKDIGDLSLEDAKNALSKIATHTEENSDIDFEEHKILLDNLQNEFTEKSAEITRLETLLSTSFVDFINPQTLEREQQILNDTIKSKEEFVEAAMLAIDVLKESGESMRKNYGGVLENKTKEIFSQLTGGKYSSLTLDNNLEMSAEEKDIFGTKSIDYLSRGTTDQAYLSFRLAIASLLSAEENLPILLDDSLSQFDDARQKTAIKFLSDYAKNNQILLFTCHGIIRDKAKESGANVINAF